MAPRDWQGTLKAVECPVCRQPGINLHVVLGANWLQG